MKLLIGSLLLFASAISLADAPKTCAFGAAKKIALQAVNSEELKENPVDANKTVIHLSAMRGMMSSSGSDVTLFLTAIRNYKDLSVRHRMIAHVVIDSSCKIKSKHTMAANSSFALGTLNDADKESQE